MQLISATRARRVTRALERNTEADGVLRAELLRYVQRKLFAEDAGSQAAGVCCAVGWLPCSVSPQSRCRCGRSRRRRAPVAQSYTPAGAGALLWRAPLASSVP